MADTLSHATVTFDIPEAAVNTTRPPASPDGQPAVPGEGSLRGLAVTVLTPFASVFAGWLSGVVANNVPGVTLDKTQVTTFMITVATTVLGMALKWLHGWQAHEKLVAAGKATAVKTPNRKSGA